MPPQAARSTLFTTRTTLLWFPVAGHGGGPRQRGVELDGRGAQQVGLGGAGGKAGNSVQGTSETHSSCCPARLCAWQVPYGSTVVARTATCCIGSSFRHDPGPKRGICQAYLLLAGVGQVLPYQCGREHKMTCLLLSITTRFPATEPHGS